MVSDTTYHVMDKGEWLKWIDWFHPQVGSTYHDLPSGKILVRVSFLHEGSEEHFMSNALKDSLPHPVFASNDPISASHAEELHFLFPDAQFADPPLGAPALSAPVVAAPTTNVPDTETMAASLQSAMSGSVSPEVVAIQKAAAAQATTQQIIARICKLNPGMRIRKW